MSETKGKCSLCGAEFTKSGMDKHLSKCLENNSNQSKGKESYFHISVYGKYNPEYWMDILFHKNWTLEKLDGFLRNIWLECCGHLSAFRINENSYAVDPDPGFGDKSMNIKVSQILSVGDKFTYEYDFGSTTELILKVLSDVTDDKKRKSAEIIARNDPPWIKCDNCDKPATQVCTECLNDNTGWLCDDCAEKHECDQEMFLPVVNSPRVGTCAYCG